MVHINHFLLLLFCISTNMAHGTGDFMDLIQDEFNQEESYNPEGWNSTSSNETRDGFNFPPQKTTPLQGLDLLQAQEITGDLWKYSTFPRKFSNPSDIFTGEVFTTNKSYNSQQQPDASNLSISSSSRGRYSLPTSGENTNNFMDLTQQASDSEAEEFFSSDSMLDLLKNTNYHFQQPLTENFEIESQQLIPQNFLPINLQSSSRVESPMSSDVEDSIVSDQEFDDQEIFISGQPLRKKRRVNKEDVSDNIYFRIICCYCSSKKQFKAQFKRDFIQNFKRHLNNQHPDITEEQTQIYIDQHLQEPELLVKFSINCPESKCKHITESVQRSNLKIRLFDHMSIKHQKNKGNYSKALIAMYVENNCEQIFVPAQEQLKNTNFIINCIHCSDRPQFSSLGKSYLISIFNEHMKTEHQSITKQETKIYISQHLQKPKLLLKRSVYCPVSGCEHIVRAGRKSNLRRNLFQHVAKKHPEKRKDYSEELLTTHLKNNCKQTFTFAQKQLKNKKRKKVDITEKQKRKVNKEDVPDNAYFTIVCCYCFCKQQFRGIDKSKFTENFKRHLKKKHPDITEEETKIYIEKHLQKPEQSVRFSVHCPKSECKYIEYASKRFNLKRKLFTHISNKRSENKDNYSRESVATYVDDNWKQILVTAQE